MAWLTLLLLLVSVTSSLEDEKRDGHEQQEVLGVDPGVEAIQAYLNVAPMAAARPFTGQIQDRRNWTAVCDSQQPPFNCSNLFDGDERSFWRSGTNQWPHTLTVDMKSVFTISGIAMLPSRDANGNIAVHEVYTSLNGIDFGSAVAYGTWWGDATGKSHSPMTPTYFMLISTAEKVAAFEPRQARYVRLIARSTALGENFLTIADFNVFVVNNALPQPVEPTRGRWGPTIDFPIVPAGGWVDPPTGKVVTYSSYGHDRFDDRANVPPEIQGRTMTATYDPAIKQVSQRIVKNTGHDMFCPGMSFDVNGRMIVSGGRTNFRTSIYVPETQSWARFSDMKVARGYQSSVTCSDGRVFVLGGSWESVNSQCVPKNGEVYDPKANTWTLLPGALTKPMLTAETSSFQGCNTFRSDNHAWLFPWKSQTVYQAGPSKATNWYTVSGSGGISPAGNRADDIDAMCGIGVMWDATRGQILTAGGSTVYAGAPARNRAFTASLDNTNFNKTVQFSATGSMAKPRIYHNAVVLPNGETFVVGGRTAGGIFVDGPESVLEPEMYSPTTRSWRPMASHLTPRNYHSFAILLPDATILSGGGGLCPGECRVNHFDAQIFTPPYLLAANGALLPRPVISSLSASTVAAGSKLTITTNGPIVSVSLIRYGSATHGLNTDQRRIPLAPADLGSNRYNVTIPSDTGVVIPGYWMVFALNAAGTPSKAATVRVRL